MTIHVGSRTLDLPPGFLQPDHIGALHSHMVDVERIEPGRARDLIRDVLEARLSELFGLYMQSMKQHNAAIFKLREDLSGMYRQLLDALHEPGDTPRDLHVDAFIDRFNVLEAEIREIVSLPDYSQKNPLGGTEDIMAVVERPGSTRDLATLEPGHIPDVIAKDPKWARLFDDPIGPEYRGPVWDNWRLERRIVMDAHARSGADPAALMAAIRAADRLATRLQARSGSWRINLRRTEDFGPYVDQQVALSPMDPSFAGTGYELVLTSPQGTIIRPDAVFREGANFRLADHKTSMTNAKSFYTSPVGETQLRVDMEMKARMSTDFEACNGWVYTTDNPDIYISLRGIISNLERQFPDLEGRIKVEMTGAR